MGILWYSVLEVVAARFTRSPQETRAYINKVSTRNEAVIYNGHVGTITSR